MWELCAAVAVAAAAVLLLEPWPGQLVDAYQDRLGPAEMVENGETVQRWRRG